MHRRISHPRILAALGVVSLGLAAAPEKVTEGIVDGGSRMAGVVKNGLADLSKAMSHTPAGADVDQTIRQDEGKVTIGGLMVQRSTWRQP